jgi:ABC-type transport system involved in multi-copper enzyme maturation permease subunit
MLGIGDYLWRLLPANPILLRVVETGGKRKRDLAIRCIYLGLLVLLVVISLFNSSATGVTNLTDLYKNSQTIFRQMSYLQLGLVSLLAPIFTAGAITQEKDSQTYDILLATPLSNAQILLGSLMSRLFFVIALLVSGIPIFSTTRIFGGVAINAIVLSVSIAAATAVITGSLAMAIATFKVGTRRTIFSFYLFIVIYLVGGYLLDQLPYFHVAGPTTSGGQESHISWFTGIHPFLALRVVLNDPTYTPPDIGMLPPNAQSWPLNWYLTNPAGFYISAMFFLSLVLVLPSILMLRRLAQSTTTLRGWALQKLRISTGDRTKKPRAVWSNPIAWREAKTKASAARATFLRWAFTICGIGGAVVMVVMFALPSSLPAQYITRGNYNPNTRMLFINGAENFGVPQGIAISLQTAAGTQPVDESYLSGRFAVVNFQTTLSRRGTKDITNILLSPISRRLSAETARDFLLGAVVLEFAVILLIVTNAAASTVTREKEDGTLDLLLTTPITSRYYIWGKLRGLVSFVLPLVAVPVISVTIFVFYDIIRQVGRDDPAFQWIVLPEAIVAIPPILIMVSAFASIVGMQMSLRCRTTVRAVMSSIGIVGGICGVLVGCGMAMLGTGARASEVQFAFAGFSPFTLLALLINPYQIASRTSGGMYSFDLGTARVFMFVSACISAGIYAAIVWTLYKSMVKNFDMTIRRQSR